MDVVLSLPILSYFSWSPTSWSSLNLLFFYMTWTTLVLSHPPMRVYLAGLLALRTMLTLFPSLIFLIFDSLIPSLAGSIKHGGSSGLPPRKPAQLARQLGLALFNLLLGVALEGGLVWGLGRLFNGGAPILKTSTTLPLPWHMIKHVSLLLVAREVLTYYIHRDILHAFATAPARLHKRFAHARTAPPMTLSILTDHPLPYLLHRVVPQLLPALAIRPHLLTYFVFVALATFEEALAMSGYSVVPGIIISGIARRTAIHYASGGKGNYAPWGIMDWACGTGSSGDVLGDLKAEAEKHRLKERSEGAVGGMLEGVRRRSSREKGKKQP